MFGTLVDLDLTPAAADEEVAVVLNEVLLMIIPGELRALIAEFARVCWIYARWTTASGELILAADRKTLSRRPLVPHDTDFSWASFPVEPWILPDTGVHTLRLRLGGGNPNSSPMPVAVEVSWICEDDRVEPPTLPGMSSVKKPNTFAPFRSIVDKQSRAPRCPLISLGSGYRTAEPSPSVTLG